MYAWGQPERRLGKYEQWVLQAFRPANMVCNLKTWSPKCLDEHVAEKGLEVLRFRSRVVTRGFDLFLAFAFHIFFFEKFRSRSAIWWAAGICQQTDKSVGGDENKASASIAAVRFFASGCDFNG
jgi:hypothetical protein